MKVILKGILGVGYSLLCVMSRQWDTETKSKEEAHLYNLHLVQAFYVSQS